MNISFMIIVVTIVIISSSRSAETRWEGVPPPGPFPGVSGSMPWALPAAPALPAFTILYYAMLCYAMLCYAMLCYTMQCNAMQCYAMLCYATLCYTILYYTILYYTILYYTILYRRAQRRLRRGNKKRRSSETRWTHLDRRAYFFPKVPWCTFSPICQNKLLLQRPH